MIKRCYIEITNVCNLKCSFCSKHTRLAHQMSLDNFEHIITQIKPITKFIYLHVQGEPLLHSQFDEILKLCDKYEMQVQLTTNGTLLNKYPYILKHPSIRKISISMHAYDEINTNIDLFLSQISCLMTQLSDNQYMELRFWNQNNLKDTSKYIIKYLHKNYQFSPTKKPNSYKLANHVYLHFDNQFVWPNDELIDEHYGQCSGVKSMIAILSNGDVTPCCLDQNCSINIGNIFNSSIYDIINSPRYCDMMLGLNQNKLTEELCRKCRYRKRFEK